MEVNIYPFALHKGEPAISVLGIFDMNVQTNVWDKQAVTALRGQTSAKLVICKNKSLFRCKIYWLMVLELALMILFELFSCLAYSIAMVLHVCIDHIKLLLFTFSRHHLSWVEPVFKSSAHFLEAPLQ